MLSKVICIAGTTGAGKSDLAISLAKAVGGEVVNADAMQVYRGLDIVTNKVTDTSGVPHHLLGTVDISQEYLVGNFVTDALRIISEIHGRNRIPIIVGGTHYYMHSLIWKNSIIAESIDDAKEDISHPSLSPELASRISSFLEATKSPQTDKDIRKAHSKKMHSLLRQVDPEMAGKWHVHDDRKIRRSLQVYYTTGTKHSDTLRLQEKNVPRFDTLLFWLRVDPVVLDKRLDSRVDSMIKQGLMDELIHMRDICAKGLVFGATVGGEIDYTRGILQSIGFKEFHDYLGLPSHDEKRESAFVNAVESMKLATRQYSRKQNNFLKNKLLKSSIQCKSGLSAFILDASDLESWKESVEAPGREISTKFALNEALPEPADVCADYERLCKEVVPDQEWKMYVCDVCRVKKEKAVDDGKVPEFRSFNGDRLWKTHLASSRHKKNVAYCKRKKLLDGE
ncbi:MAG: hypothetical protein SGCHY_001689 [Lobulomycetales sp.]